MKYSAKILIVDDEKMVLKPLKMLLELEGYKDIFCYDNPLDAVDFLHENSVDLIISDFIMPQMNGIEFLLEAKKYNPDTTQILLTGYADKENAIKAINDLQIYKYIEKPWNSDDLLISIKNGIERTKLKSEIKNHIKKLEELNLSLEHKVEERTIELKKTNLKLSGIISSCADGIVIFDSNFKITLANQTCENLFGMSERQLVGKNFFEVIINEKNLNFYDDLKNKKTLYLRDFYLINYKDNRRIPIEINIAKIDDIKGDFFVASIRDVSYQKEIEELKDDFVATLTHDLRTPILASIRGLEFILNKSLGELTDKQELTLDTMKRSQEDVLGLVNALLEVYRYESGKLLLTKTQFCLNRLINDSVEEMKPLIDEKNIEIIKEPEGGDGEFLINADRGEIKRVIVNILSNAIKHSNDSSKVIIKTKKDNKDLVFSIQDFGSGLDKEDCEKLFKRFSQGTNRKRACSTGLGLYLSRQIVEAHNGKIWVESEINHGSTFSFILKNAITENRVLI